MNTADSPLTYSIVIPAYNEASLIVDSLTKLKQYLHDQNMLANTEVIVVAADGGDGTIALVKAIKGNFQHFQLLEPGHKVGKGRDVRLGMLAASGAYRLFMDADLATPLTHIRPAFDTLEQGSDLVIGVRNLRKIHQGSRLFGSFGSNLLIRLVALPGHRDTQCGFKAFTADACERIFSRLIISGWGFDIELLVMARSAKMRVATLAITDWTDPKADSNSGLVGESNFKALTHTLQELLEIKWRKLKGRYKSI